MIWYVYPQWHRVSFTLVSEKHIEYLSKRIRIEKIDELAFPSIYPHSKPLVLMHPTFYPLSKYGRYLEKNMHFYRGIIGFDVADSDHITGLAVSMTHYTTAMIVPSKYARQTYIRSGVRVPVYTVPHGLDKEWYTKPRQTGKTFEEIARLKRGKGYKIILFFCIHSEYRKGADLVIDFYTKLKKERRDVILVLKTLTYDGTLQNIVKRIGGIVVAGWLREDQKMELFDLADLYTLFSRGGGFEMIGLEALARSVPVLAPEGGSWEEYMPKWGLVKSRVCPYVLKDNPIHDGRGVEIDVERAVDKAHIILDNLEDYRARAEEYKKKFLYNIYRWDKVADALIKIIRRYY